MSFDVAKDASVVGWGGMYVFTVHICEVCLGRGVGVGVGVVMVVSC